MFMSMKRDWLSLDAAFTIVDFKRSYQTIMLSRTANPAISSFNVVNVAKRNKLVYFAGQRLMNVNTINLPAELILYVSTN